MTLWLILTLIVAVTVAVLTIPLVRRYDAADRSGDIARRVLADQLTLVDAQAAAGTIAPDEADALRTETKRRLLVETVAEARARPVGSNALGQIAIAVAVLVTLGGTLLYSRLGAPEAAAPSADVAAAATLATAPDATSLQMIAAIETKLKAKPGDVDGWRMLGWARYSVGQFGPAADAYTRAIELAPARGDLRSALGEALTLAANGTVSPPAKTAFDAAVAADAGDARARYFLGVARDQAGDHAGAVATWLALLQSAPPGAPWTVPVRRAVTEVAAAAKIDLTGRLPADVPAPATSAPLSAPAATAAGAIPPPSGDAAAAVKALPRGDQAAMIRQMVDGLAARLKASPQDPDGWLRLIRARMVLGDAAAAAAARTTALATLTDPAARTRLADGAKALGVPAT